jgi:hypothetical protein
MITMRMIWIILAAALFSPILAQSGQESYNQGIDLLYKQNRPEEALEKFQAALAAEPDSWSRPFMVGYTLKAYLKKPEEALGYLEKAAGLARGEDEVAYREYVQCLEILKQFDDAIAQNLAGQQALRAKGKTPSAWFVENLAWVYYLKGDIANAARYAPSGSWVASQIADRTIEIDWKLRLTQLLESWRISDQKTIRLTLPIDRPYQKLTSARVTSLGREKIRTRRVAGRGNQFVEITRLGEKWPDQIRLQLTVDQNMRPIASHPAGLRRARPGEPEYAWASENADGLFALDNPEFIEKMNRLSAGASTPGEKADVLLRHLRANFKYGEKPQGGNVNDWLEFGSGDCGYFTFIAIAMLRSQGIPVRGLYGVGPWTDPPPALPHSILEIYDASTGRWFPHDPQSDNLFGIINPSYVPFTAGSPKNDAAVFADDKVWEIDTVWFFWSGSGKDTIAYNVRLKTQTASRALGEKPANYKEPGRGGPPPARLPR